MAKVISCKDVGSDCTWVGRAETEEELLKMAAKHGADVHGMKNIPKEMLEKVKSAIHDE